MILTSLAVIATTIVAAAGTAMATKLAAERAVAKQLEGLARPVNLPRRSGESVYAWNKRIGAALDELFEASTEFISSAMRERTETREGRVSRWALPAEHPASIRLAKARNEPVTITKQSPYRGVA